MSVFKNVKKEDLTPLLNKNFGVDKPKTIYEVARYKNNDATLVLYTSGKLVVQGKEATKVTKELEKHGLEKIKQQQFRKEDGWMIGSDESLKGDTFGGITVAAVRADDTIRKKLKEIGVADSKKLKDKEIFYLADQIKRIAPCEIISMLPEEYNKEKSQTDLLNKLHKNSAKDLGNGQHVVDKYPGCRVGSIRETKAEEKYLEVAAASILARAAAVHQIEFLSAEAGFPLPKGSTHVKLALQELKLKKLSFRKFVKLHFKNVEEFL
jgi:ribonuclease HIII